MSIALAGGAVSRVDAGMPTAPRSRPEYQVERRSETLAVPPKTGTEMYEREPKRWVSLGLLIGGFSPSHEALSPSSAVGSQTIPPMDSAPLTAEEQEHEETMRAAGYEPKIRFPGARSMPWPSECSTCGAPRKPSLQDVERGIRCQHVWGRRSGSSRG
ncbi:hypothetical protein ACFUJT_08115 [Streptomyces griseoincarnatus]